MSSSSSRLGVTARNLLSARAGGLPRIVAPYATRLSVSPFSTSVSRNETTERVLRRMSESINPRPEKERSPRTETRHLKNRSLADIATEALSMVLPGTFVRPPLSQFPKPLGQKFRFLGYWVVMKAQEVLTNATLKYTSKPSFFQRALFRPKRSVLIPTAKSLHRAMAESFASGDKDTLNRLCTRALAGPLLASIDKRPKGRRYGWELVQYTKKPFYPSIKSHRLSPLGRERHAPISRQAVVAISSKQRRVVYDHEGQVVPGSEKEMDVIEYVTIGCLVDPKTWKQTEWRLVGTIRPTTYEGWLEEKELLANMMRENQV